jgi:methyl-accepting chemotaxis protein
MSLNATAVSILTYACELLTRVVENTKITINIQPSEKPEVSQTEQVKQTNEQTNEQVNEQTNEQVNEQAEQVNEQVKQAKQTNEQATQTNEQAKQAKQTNEQAKQTNEQVKQSKQANNVEVKDPCENIQKTRGLIHTDLLQLIDVLERVCAIVKKINKSMIDDELWNDLWMD